MMEGPRPSPEHAAYLFSWWNKRRKTILEGDVVPSPETPTAMSLLDNTGGAEPGGATLHHRLRADSATGEPYGATLHHKVTHDPPQVSESNHPSKKARSELQPGTPGPCTMEASSGTATAPLGNHSVIPYVSLDAASSTDTSLDYTLPASSSSTSSLLVIRPRPGLDLYEPEVPLLVPGRLPLSTTVSTKFDKKEGCRIDKLDGVDKKGDHGIDKLGNLNKKDGHTAKKPRLASPTFSDKVLNKFGLPFNSVQDNAVQHGARPPAHHIYRSLRRDGENKDSLRKLPASRIDRLRPPCPPTESHARERERSRSLEK
jgi:hypothetical protein